uniref:Galectin n=1 Tax=Echeneis naucrates TaxID=173247 RepID=A0A665UIN6_ECHNA
GQPPANPTWPGGVSAGQGVWPGGNPSQPACLFFSRITLDLSTANDIAFHFNPRFNESGSKVIVRNSRVGKKWGKEERALQHFPFVQGQPFEIKILCTNREFKVAVNNSHLLEFKHRITDLISINRLNIHNDLSLDNRSSIKHFKQI